MTTNQPPRPWTISRYLALAWFALVGLAFAAGTILVFVPSELLSHFGRERCVAYALAFVLLVAVVGLPLLVLAALLDRKARRGTK